MQSRQAKWMAEMSGFEKEEEQEDSRFCTEKFNF
jgi:hypothetical protein